MRAACLWSIHDFPALGMFAAWSTHGTLACPRCLGDTHAFKLRHGGKASWFDCHRRFLPIGHDFRTQASAFRKNTIVLDEPPRELTGEEIEASWPCANSKWCCKEGYNESDCKSTKCTAVKIHVI